MLLVNLILVALLLPGCTAYEAQAPQKRKTVLDPQKELVMSQDFNPEVLEWLKEAPFDDPLALKQKPDFSYEEWFGRGRSLPRVVETLIKLLEQEGTEQASGHGVRAAYALGWVGDRRKQIIQSLMKAIGSKDLSLRIEAVSALGRQGDPSVFPTLEKLLLNRKEDVNVRANACIAIGRLGVPSSERLLTNTLKDSEPFIGRCAEEALRLLREKATTPPNQ